ncbi:ATP-grasp domain-containing protein [Nostoc sp. FACHB-87]|uniref:ATP-grasp domain-containing protein n=1 Tax=Nostocaceae TaxID=1162 RepID=UPI0016852288|nr:MULTISPECIES: ATP-grasp domain-containing protein [Nostocaceae]MBD2454799.1 ATP-grasp domain-containing protein [Nostoc sp. FACHB-87]MBD2476743.1 ATP-grasp domain-containing protein [Anabaena sp. FACHB-83]
MIQKAFIQEKGNGRMEPEMADLLAELNHRGIPVETFTEKRLHRRQLPLATDTLVAGYIPVVLGALRQLGIDLPNLTDYPQCLQAFLHRQIWRSTVGQIIQRIYDDHAPIFAKPQNRKKQFTGHVFASPSDLMYLQGTSHRTPVYCSEVVEWLSEYRVFVIRGEIVGIKHYWGNSSVAVDLSAITEAVQLLNVSGEGTAAYGIDFGVLSDGVTALIEWNDGFALGSYGLDKSLYTDLIVTRWCELTGVFI